MAATLDDLKDVLLSIKDSVTEQKDILSGMLQMQVTRDRLAGVNTSTVQQSGGSSIGEAVAGTGLGIGAALSGAGTAAVGGGIGGLLGMAALAVFTTIDANAIKENVVTLLSISDEVGGKAEILKEGGAFFLAMTGIGLGLAAFGVGQSLVALGQWVTETDWTITLKNNISTLLSISTLVNDSMIDTLGAGGTLAAVLYGIGFGLRRFAVGAFVNNLSELFADWASEGNWTINLKNNISNLLSISTLVNGSMLETLGATGVFAGVMYGLGWGLRRFSIGAGITAASELFADWASGGDWAASVKNNVFTLLSISQGLSGGGYLEAFGETGTFAVMMYGIGWGLKRFALGAGISSVAELFADWASGGDWATSVKDNVFTLLSISQGLSGGGLIEAFGETGTFAAMMYGIGWGLKKFALGAGVSSIAEAISDWAAGGDWALQIKNSVMTLLSISEGLSGEGQLAAFGEGGTFVAVMAGIAAGLGVFTVGNLAGTLVNVATDIVSFLTGSESPITQVRQIAEDAPLLERGANAIVKIAEALETFANIDMSGNNFDFTGMAKELGKAIPFLDALANGGYVEGSAGWFDGGITFEKGLLNPDLRLDEMAAAIAKVNYTLGRTSEYPVDAVIQSAAAATAESPIAFGAAESLRMQREAEIIRVAQIQTDSIVIRNPNGAGDTNINADNSVRTDARTYVGGATYIAPPAPRTYPQLNYGLPNGIGPQ
jgi:hypothetical protein